ncbi:hypothetical protein [Anabaena sp. UHCC 0187]|uniref:hypothetical protein n=1 Tax=Anabaena sp. UHCC 0187 TaxID=2590018 RepID=UPI001447766B|nr:hypothetical protein [Anabaena sp. UHCC 0187]
MKTYQDLLKPWAVFCLKESVRHVCVARFRTRIDAEQYRSLISRANSNFFYEVVFDND